MKLGISVSDLDSFRRYRCDEEMGLPDLLRTLRREEPPTDAMKAGTALHSFLELAGPGDYSSDVSIDGHLFVIGELDADLVLPSCREISGSKVYQIGDHTVQARARVDGIDGRVTEYKLTKNFDAERYHDRFQWRMYLSIFGLDRIDFNVFVASDKGPHTTADGRVLSKWEIRDVHQITFYRYPELEADIERELGYFVEFVLDNLDLVGNLVKEKSGGTPSSSVEAQPLRDSFVTAPGSVPPPIGPGASRRTG